MNSNQDRFSDSHLIASAKGCETLADLQRRVLWPDFQALRAACDRLNIDLPIVRKTRAGTTRKAQAVPKPVAKGAKPKGGVE